MVLVAAMLGTGCASSGNLDGDSAPGTHVAAARNVCPSGYLLVCEVRSGNRISDGRYGYRKYGRKDCGCQSDSGLESMKRRQLLRN